mgnify:CR=1 FL=1
MEDADTCPLDCTDILLQTDSEAGTDTDASGIMFFVIPQRDIVVTSIDIFSIIEEGGLDSVKRVEVYTKEGGYAGSESNEDAWENVYNNMQSLQGPNAPTRLNLNNMEGVAIPAYSTQSFFIYSDEARIVASLQGDMTSDNALEIYQGIEVDEKWEGGISSVLSFKGAFR